MDVTCAKCSEPATIADPGDGRAVVWKCPACGATNGIKGHAGEPGEGALNPAASALSDEELAEAYGRRIGGTIHTLDVGGTVGPEGGVSA